jgi:hypothetical protein
VPKPEHPGAEPRGHEDVDEGMRDAVAREHVVARRVRVRPVDVAGVLLERELAERRPTRRGRRAPGLESELPQRQRRCTASSRARQMGWDWKESSKHLRARRAAATASPHRSDAAASAGA